MSDYTITVDYNTGTDASPTWTGTTLTFGGTSGAMEVRFTNAGLGNGGSTSSNNWIPTTKPGSGSAAFAQAWAFTADTTGVQTTYVGDDGGGNHNTVARVFRFNWSGGGTFASSPQFSCFDGGIPNSHNTPSLGTQPSIVNGTSDTSNTSYMKINAYGAGLTSGGAQQTPSAGSVGSNPTATTAGIVVSPPVTPAWLTNWISAQGWLATSYIVNIGVPQATSSGLWYWTCVLFYSAVQSAANYSFVTTLQYTFS